MKIAYFCNVLPWPPVSGNRRRHLDEIQSLSSVHDVFLFFIGSGEISQDDLDILSLYCVSIFHLKLKTVSRLRQFFSFRPKWWLNARVLSRSSYFISYFNGIDPDIVISNYFDSLCLLSYLDLPASRVVFIPHDNMCEFYYNAFWVNGNLIYKLYYLLEMLKHKASESSLLSSVRNIIVFSQLDKRYYSSRCDHRVRILLSPISIHAIPLEVKGTFDGSVMPQYIIVSNGTHPIGRHEVQSFFKHVPRLIRKPCVIIVIGSGWANKQLVIGSVVIKYIGFVQQLAPYYHASSASIVPVFRPSGMNVKISEALSFGLPIISTHAALSRFPKSHLIESDVCHNYADFAASIDRRSTSNILTKSHSNLAYARNFLSHDLCMMRYLSFLNVICP